MAGRGARSHTGVKVAAQPHGVAQPEHRAHHRPPAIHAAPTVAVPADRCSPRPLHTHRCTLSDDSSRLLRWMSRSMYTSASTKHSGLQLAYLLMLQGRRDGGGGNRRGRAGECRRRLVASTTCTGRYLCVPPLVVPLTAPGSPGHRWTAGAARGTLSPHPGRAAAEGAAATRQAFGRSGRCNNVSVSQFVRRAHGPAAPQRAWRRCQCAHSVPRCHYRRHGVDGRQCSPATAVTEWAVTSAAKRAAGRRHDASAAASAGTMRVWRASTSGRTPHGRAAVGPRTLPRPVATNRVVGGDQPRQHAGQHLHERLAALRGRHCCSGLGSQGAQARGSRVGAGLRGSRRERWISSSQGAPLAAGATNGLLAPCPTDRMSERRRSTTATAALNPDAPETAQRASQCECSGPVGGAKRARELNRQVGT
jgi:hypothetical protein